MPDKMKDKPRLNSKPREELKLPPLKVRVEDRSVWSTREKPKKNEDVGKILANLAIES